MDVREGPATNSENHYEESAMPKAIVKRRLPVAAALVALAAGAVPAQQAVGTGGGLIPDGAPPTVDLLYTGDVIGYLDPCG